MIAPTSWRPPEGRRRTEPRSAHRRAQSARRCHADDITSASVLCDFRACRQLSRPVTSQRNRVAMYVRLRDCRSRRELSGDVRVASGVQRTAVQRARARRSCGRVSHSDCVHTRVKKTDVCLWGTMCVTDDAWWSGVLHRLEPLSHPSGRDLCFECERSRTSGLRESQAPMELAVQSRL